MKPRRFSPRFATAFVSAAFVCAPLLAADNVQIPGAPAGDNTSVGITVAAPQPAPKTVWMSREAGEVLKLVRAGVNEEVVMAYISHSRAGFNLTADEIVQLHNEGVSDKMINAMLSNHRQAPQTIIAAQPQPQQVQEAPAQQQVIQPTTPAPTIVTQPSVTYVQSEPVYVPSTSYVYSSPYYYDPFWYPSVSIGFGWGWGGRSYYGGHYYGGHYAPHYVGSYHGAYNHFGASHVGGGWSGAYHGGFSGGGHWGGGGGGHHR